MTEARQLERPPAPDEVDQRVYLHGVSWAEYEALLVMRGESSVPRITYLEGEVELMSPSRSHESLKKRLARLVEAWSEESGIDLEGVGSWTLKESREERGAEPDECYVVGGYDDFERPDFAIEVVWTSGGISKLEVYRRLGVREVWFFEDGALKMWPKILPSPPLRSTSRSAAGQPQTHHQCARGCPTTPRDAPRSGCSVRISGHILSFHALRGDRYERIPRSEVLPSFDADLVVRFMNETTQSRAVRELRKAMRDAE